MADACMGVTRLWKAAKSQHFREPLEVNGPFVPEEVVKKLLVEREKADPMLLQKVECNQHNAANLHGRKSEMYQVQGIAAQMCRHEQVTCSPLPLTIHHIP